MSVNAALYGPGWTRWAMTERGAASLSRDDDRYHVGDSGIAWTGDGFRVAVNERSVPHLAPLRGEIRVRPDALYQDEYRLDAKGRHWWRPIAPSARIDVDFGRPDWRWSGAGYVDMNWGYEPIEAGFARWDWSRAPLRDGAAVLYDATRRDGSDLSLALRFDGRGGVEPFAPPPRTPLPKTLWRLDRRIQADADRAPIVARRLEDSPFYARSEIRSRLLGEDVLAVHESLDLDRFAQRWVKALLPWRMPRIAF